MEIFQTIYEILMTPNIELCNIIVSPLAIIETIVTMLLFTNILSIKTSTQHKIIYSIFLSTWTIISNYFIIKPYGLYCNMLIAVLAVHFIFKQPISKSIASMFITILSVAIFETIVTKIYYTFSLISYDELTSIPIYRLSSTLLIYLCIFLTYIITKNFQPNKILNNIRITTNSSKRLFGVNLVLGIIIVSTQSYLIMFYNEYLPFSIVFISIISLSAYFSISIYSLYKTSKLEETTQNLEESKLYNKTLEILHDNMRAFKHDFANIIQALSGYIETEDIPGLKKYFKELNTECIDNNNLYALNPKSINNPAIYSVLASKYYKADQVGIKINLEIFLDLNQLNMKIYQFTRILGILLDNAIEASKECEEKIINLIIRNDTKVKRQLLIIENTYLEKEINTEKIFEKGFSTKPQNSGIGLWEVRQILKKHNNLNLFTNKDEKFFNQQLEIY